MDINERVLTMEPLPDLKPCPYCGSASVYLVGLAVRCGTCCAAGPFGTNPEQAVKRWNDRANDSSSLGAWMESQKIPEK